MRIIFELIHYLESKGHKNRLYIFGETRYRDGEHARRTISERYRPFNSEVVLGVDNMPVPDVLISAGWQTAWASYHHLPARKKLYLIQDYEPYFYSRGADYILSEAPLRFDWSAISLGPWAKKVASQFGLRSTSFDFASDHGTFYPNDNVARDENTIVYYGRHVTPRRAYELGIAALYHVSKDRPATRIIIHGWEWGSGQVPFDHFDLGVMPDHERAQLYREATVGMALSLTNPSMVPLEMMDCKLPVVELKGDNTVTFYGENHDSLLSLADPLPRKIADAIIELLDNPQKRKARAEAAYQFTVNRTWPEAGRIVEQTLIDELKSSIDPATAGGRTNDVAR
jgi:glycosyltransferase involved in cell wall biosynthesis